MKNLNFIDARKAIGLTQLELANKLEYQKSTISNWENGYSNPRIDDALRLASILEKDISFLFFNHYVQQYHTSCVREQ